MKRPVLLHRMAIFKEDFSLSLEVNVTHDLPHGSAGAVGFAGKALSSSTEQNCSHAQELAT